MSLDLTTLARVKVYLGITGNTATADAQLAPLIPAVSRVVLNYVNRASFAVAEFTDVYDGSGKDFMLLRQWPVLSVASIDTCGTTIPASPDTTRWPPASGFVLETADTVGGAQQRVMLYGYRFPSGRGTVRVTYTAGYKTDDEPHTVPATPYQVTTDSVWLADAGVTLANGTPLVAVAASPAAGQYAVDSAGVYTFNSAQTAAAVLISYSSVPADVTDAVNQLIAEAYRRTDRIGIVSQSVAGQETVAYSQKDMGDAIQLALNPFRRVTPT